MARVNGATLLARALQLGGVGPVFTLSGHQILPIYDAGIDENLRFVDTRHEGAAVHMADGWGRLTGQTGVALVTAAPGHTNALTGVATAFNSESPLLLLSGGAEVPNLGRGGFQEMDQLTMIGPISQGRLDAEDRRGDPGTRGAGVPGRHQRRAGAGPPDPAVRRPPPDRRRGRRPPAGAEPLPAAPARPRPTEQIARLLELLGASRAPDRPGRPLGHARARRRRSWRTCPS